MTFASIYHASIEKKVVLLYMEGNKINQNQTHYSRHCSPPPLSKFPAPAFR